MYMIGGTRETAEPMITFYSKEEDCRKKVRKVVEESGILDRYPGVRAGDWSKANFGAVHVDFAVLGSGA